MAEPETLPIEETVKRIMADFRYRRMKYRVDHPESIENDDLVPETLGRHAEAVAIVSAVRRA